MIPTGKGRPVSNWECYNAGRIHTAPWKTLHLPLLLGAPVINPVVAESSEIEIAVGFIRFPERLSQGCSEPQGRIFHRQKKSEVEIIDQLGMKILLCKAGYSLFTVTAFW